MAKLSTKIWKNWSQFQMARFMARNSKWPENIFYGQGGSNKARLEKSGHQMARLATLFWKLPLRTTDKLIRIASWWDLFSEPYKSFAATCSTLNPVKLINKSMHQRMRDWIIETHMIQKIHTQYYSKVRWGRWAMIWTLNHRSWCRDKEETNHCFNGKPTCLYPQHLPQITVSGKFTARFIL